MAAKTRHYRAIRRVFVHIDKIIAKNKQFQELVVTNKLEYDAAVRYLETRNQRYIVIGDRFLIYKEHYKV